ncbi:metallophosphoesterase family protein [Falsiroseomonas sp. CW058]|uniref:metallophosphoesterase family protein n=1 Tax=Falsiroseomonas sp. CW058 TaxID=3388664 RepID=UPI003D319B65
MPRILQITDTHLSARNGGLFRDNIARIAEAVAATPPDLVMATGDISLDGADRDEDLDFAVAALRELPWPLMILPGNHDTGSHARFMPRQPVDDARMARWRRIAGPGRGVVDLEGWRAIGLNTEVMGTGHPEEAAQAAFIAEAAAGAGDRRIALFLHKPLSLTLPEDPAFDMWTVPPAGRPALAPLLAHPGLRLVGSGHLHLHHEVTRGRVAWVWAPALSFVMEVAEQAGIPGARRCGALLHDLHEDHATTRLVAPAGVETVGFLSVRDRTYPPGATP